MPSLPSHQRLCFQKGPSSHILLINPRASHSFLLVPITIVLSVVCERRSVCSHHQVPIFLITAQLTCSRGAIDQTIHPRAQQGGTL